MLQHKLQTIEQSIIQQSGQDRLILNDIVFNRDAVQMLAVLIPKYHQNIRHIQIKGNNIDSEGFEIIFSSLMHCSHLKSIEAEWNNIGSADRVNGFQTLAYLVKKLHYLQFIDLKNNRITHVLGFILSEIIQANRPNLKVIDLRWNDLGELGAKNILRSLPYNKNIKFIGLQDNRISTGTLSEIQCLLKQSQNIQNMGQDVSVKVISDKNNVLYPFSGGQYASMDGQLKNAELRGKIDIQQKQTSLYVQKVEVEIEKVLQKIKLRGTQANELQSKYQNLMLENRKIIDDLRQAERMVTLQKQRIFGIQRNLAQQKSRMRTQKYRLNTSIQSVMEKYTQRNQRQLQQIDLVMGQKLDRLNNFLKERLHQKRNNRQKLTQLKQDIMKMKVDREDCWSKGSSVASLSVKSAWQQQCYALQELINKSKSTINSQTKKGDHLSSELKNIILRALKKQDKLEGDIFQYQNKIKKIHNDMALRNLQNQVNIINLKRKQSQQIDKEASIKIMRLYLRFIQQQHSINTQIQHLKDQELKKANNVGQDSVDVRIEELDRALRAQQAQNKLIRNQYEKLLVLVQNSTKKALQNVLFD